MTPIKWARVGEIRLQLDQRQRWRLRNRHRRRQQPHLQSHPHPHPHHRQHQHQEAHQPREPQPSYQQCSRKDKQQIVQPDSQRCQQLREKRDSHSWPKHQVLLGSHLQSQSLHQLKETSLPSPADEPPPKASSSVGTLRAEPSPRALNFTSMAYLSTAASSASCLSTSLFPTSISPPTTMPLPVFNSSSGLFQSFNSLIDLLPQNSSLNPTLLSLLFYILTGLPDVRSCRDSAQPPGLADQPPQVISSFAAPLARSHLPEANPSSTEITNFEALGQKSDQRSRSSSPLETESELTRPICSTVEATADFDEATVRGRAYSLHTTSRESRQDGTLLGYGLTKSEQTWITKASTRETAPVSPGQLTPSRCTHSLESCLCSTPSSDGTSLSEEPSYLPSREKAAPNVALTTDL
ncbi:unnamed protein product, partial [Protopolystoma xenopodis]